MKNRTLATLLALCFGVTCLTSCFQQKDQVQPLSGSKWGEIRNASAEDVISHQVAYWSWQGGGAYPLGFYDQEAHEGNQSLIIRSPQPSWGAWENKINVKPWSTYKFTGWIKTQDIEAAPGSGVGFELTNVTPVAWRKIAATPPVFTGTHDWTQVEIVFETGPNDGTILRCFYGSESPVRGTAWFDHMSLEQLKTKRIRHHVTIDPSATGTPMEPYIYGQFIEHLGRCIYGGIWAEMLMDRKFYYAPNLRESPWKVTGNDPDGPMFYMDEKQPYTGVHTPVLVAQNNNGVALTQQGLGVCAGVGVTGHVVLRANVPMSVQVELVTSHAVHKTLLSVGTTYREYPLAFEPFERTDPNARLRIVPLLSGQLAVGTISLMPQNNVQGFRADVLELLRQLDAPVYRWPGGNFVSGYNWKDGIGPRDTRPPRKNPAWTGIESNDVGLHEFIELCRLLHTEPYIAVNAGLGGAKQAAEQVQYCNGDAGTPMGGWRAANGDKTPWNVKWWSIGNEMYGSWQLGHMSTQEFVAKHTEFAQAMRKEDPSIELIAVGNIGPWDEMMLSHCQDHMDLLSEHFYCQDWNGTGLMTHTAQIPNNIRYIAQSFRSYRDSIPGLKDKNIKICMDEWNFWYGPHIYGELGTRYYLRDALGVAAGLHEYLRQSDVIFMANYAQTVNVIGAIKTTSTHACFAATGEVLKTYRHHFGTIPVALKGLSKMSLLDVAAAIDPNDRTLTVGIVNPTYQTQPLKLSFAEHKVDHRGVKVYTITGANDMAYNTPGLPPRVTTQESVVTVGRQVEVPPFSVVIYAFPLLLEACK